MHHFFFCEVVSQLLWELKTSAPRSDLEDNKTATGWMKTSTAQVYNGNHAKKMLFFFPDDFGLKNPVIQIPFQTKNDTYRYTVACA